MSISGNEDYDFECSRCKTEITENAKICPNCGENLDETKEGNEVNNGTGSIEEKDFFKKHNMVRKTLSVLEEEQRSEFQTALNFIESGKVKRGIFQLEKIMYEDGLKLIDGNWPLVLGEVYLKYDMTKQCEEYIDFINKKFPDYRDKIEELKAKLNDKN